jgi:hypothetical protein
VELIAKRKRRRSRKCAYFIFSFVKKKKNKAIAVTGRGDLLGCKTLRLSLFLDNRLSSTRGYRLYAPSALHPPGRFPVLIPVRGRVKHRATVRLRGLGKLKIKMCISYKCNGRPNYIFQTVYAGVDSELFTLMELLNL